MKVTIDLTISKTITAELPDDIIKDDFYWQMKDGKLTYNILHMGDVDVEGHVDEEYIETLEISDENDNLLYSQSI